MSLQDTVRYHCMHPRCEKFCMGYIEKKNPNGEEDELICHCGHLKITHALSRDDPRPNYLMNGFTSSGTLSGSTPTSVRDPNTFYMSSSDEMKGRFQTPTISKKFSKY